MARRPKRTKEEILNEKTERRKALDLEIEELKKKVEDEKDKIILKIFRKSELFQLLPKEIEKKEMDIIKFFNSILAGAVLQETESANE